MPNAGSRPGSLPPYRGTSLIRNNLPLGPYSRPMPYGGPTVGAGSYERGTPVLPREGRLKQNAGISRDERGPKDSQEQELGKRSPPPWRAWRQPRGKTIVYLVDSHTNATSKR